MMVQKSTVNQETKQFNKSLSLLSQAPKPYFFSSLPFLHKLNKPPQIIYS